MKNLLHDTYFVLNNSGKEDPTVYDYHFTSASGNSVVRVLWHCPEYSYDWRPLQPRRQKKDVSIRIPDGFSQVRKITPEAGSTTGREELLSADASGKVELTLGSTPVFLLFD